MLIATVLSLAYVLRYISHVFFGSAKSEKVKEVPVFMTLAMLILAMLVTVLGVWPAFFLDIINAGGLG
jgi:NADH:ubiquinone oxidoreductase subunit 5 (subunit L)/multisubunit Na+/H+ antiporter MnhA subunit